jgi:glycosyltransferase involved in cell wall biosynthesis
VAHAWSPPELPPRIGINAIFLEPRMGGLDTYVRALVPALARTAPEVEFSVFCNPRGRDYLAADGLAEHARLVTHPLLGRRGLKAASELTVLGLIAGRSVDLLHSVALTAPLKTRAVNVVKLADLTWIVAPDRGETATIMLWRLVVPPVARRADRVIAVSEASAQHIVEYLHVPRDRIDVVPNAPAPTAGVQPTPSPELRARLGLGDGPVVLTVSAKKVNKNLRRLVEAMAIVVQRWPDAVCVMPGNPTAHERELRELAVELGLADHVVFPDYVSAADLEGLYGLASCFVFASINEGFGIPILEAMRRGVPVACARATALPEVAGEAARYFDPYDVDDIAAAIADILGDEQLAARLSDAGLVRQAQFSWERSARETLDSYARAWAARRRR